MSGVSARWVLALLALALAGLTIGVWETYRVLRESVGHAHRTNRGTRRIIGDVNEKVGPFGVALRSILAEARTHQAETAVLAERIDEVAWLIAELDVQGTARGPSWIRAGRSGPTGTEGA